MTLIQLKNKNNNRIPAFPSFIGDFFNDFMSDELINRDVFKSIPAVNISESSDAFEVELAAPGMKKNDFKVAVENGVMTISAEKKAETKSEDSKFTRKEFSYQSFNRAFTLPEHVNADSIAAEYTNGILKLSLPKKAEAKQPAIREIAVS